MLDKCPVCDGGELLFREKARKNPEPIRELSRDKVIAELEIARQDLDYWTSDDAPSSACGDGVVATSQWISLLQMRLGELESAAGPERTS